MFRPSLSSQFIYIPLSDITNICKSAIRHIHTVTGIMLSIICVVFVR